MKGGEGPPRGRYLHSSVRACSVSTFLFSAQSKVSVIDSLLYLCKTRM